MSDQWEVAVNRIIQHPDRPIRGVLLVNRRYHVYAIATGGTRLLVPSRWAMQVIDAERREPEPAS